MAKLETIILSKDEIQKFIVDGVLASRGQARADYMADKDALISWRNIPDAGLIAALTIVQRPAKLTGESVPPKSKKGES